MKKILLAVLEAGVLFGCLSIGLGQTPQKPLENVFTLELSFGDKNLPDEYLLARPIWLDINNAGDIYVYDEYKIKVFDKNGKPKTIFGGRGQGPGEFDNIFFSHFLSPENWLSVFDWNSWSVFSPANKFISKNVFSSSVIFNTLKNDYKISMSANGAVQRLYVLNDKEIIVKGNTATFDNYNEAGEYYDYIIYINRDKIYDIAKYRNVDTYLYKSGSLNGSKGYNILGRLWLEILPGSKIVYTHTQHDVTYINDIAYLTFHVISLVNNTKSDFVIPYKPTIIADSTINKFDPSYIEKMANKSPRTSEIPSYSKAEKEIDTKVFNILKKEKYHRLFTTMRSDGAYLLLELSATKNNTKKVINSESGKEVCNFIYPESLYMGQFKNGYGYRLYIPKDGYPVVEKYRIDPRVYGK
jgi:hypothetical protein